ncbi:hypothetical protein LFYK43_04460 [Ligilactobacillus salitolerans]|uniref:Putative membrane protein insertion efficiency factor n=1 Tax=Ligilactobacillus salitolerans TaxID=1808352 RepID=A0A401IR40_9LACO|nr:membrane protein insertion efficiency factor YidD [Ligilactobacillus salitolerans]GBG93987.1 hypothetical protein LFYK43_04460 [Ligilactobacillus salitolerans]
MKNILIFPIKIYQKVISPLFPPSCRYYPTCSNYALQALEKHGLILGAVMALARIIRCNPFIRGGYDPVPEKFSIFRNLDWVNEDSAAAEWRKKNEQRKKY